MQYMEFSAECWYNTGGKGRSIIFEVASPHGPFGFSFLFNHGDFNRVWKASLKGRGSWLSSLVATLVLGASGILQTIRDKAGANSSIKERSRGLISKDKYVSPNERPFGVCLGILMGSSGTISWLSKISKMLQKG